MWGMDLTTTQDTTELAAPNDDARVVELWLRDRCENTVDMYSRYALPLLERAPIRGLTHADVSDYVQEAKSVSVAACRAAATKSLLSFAHAIGYTRYNVGASVRVPRVPRREVYVTQSQVHRLLLQLKGEKHLIARVMYYAGARVHAACSLRRGDLEPREHGAQLRLLGKGRRVRRVLLPPALARDLTRHRIDLGGGDDEWMWPARAGHVSPRSMQRALRLASERLNFSEPITPHVLRHAHGTHAVERGAPLHVVQHTMGHASIATTGRYLHARPTDSSSLYLGE